MRNLKFFFLSVFLLLTNNCFAQEIVLSKKQMHEDVDYYFDTLAKCHPNLYIKYSPVIFDSIRQNVKNLCEDSLKITQFCYILSKTAKYTDGHTGGFVQYLLNSSNINPLPVLKFDKYNNIYYGDKKIISINGICGEQIGKDIDQLISWEYNSFRKNNLMHKFFPVAMNYGYKVSLPFNIKLLKDEMGLSKDTIFELISITQFDDELLSVNERESFGFSNDLHKNGFVNNKIFREDSIAILYYNDAYLSRFKNNYEATVKAFTDSVSSFFNESKLKDIKYLFIDVSHNQGGDDSANSIILNHLKFPNTLIVTTTIAEKEGAIRNYESKKELFKNSEAGAEWLKKIAQPLIDRGRISDSIIIEANVGFDKGVFIIMSPNTYSAAFDFCQNVKLLHAGILVGMPPGQRSPYSGNVVTDKLPNSQLMFMFPTTFTIIEPRVTDNEGFLQPDISYTLDHILTIDDYKEIIKKRKSQINHE